MGPRALAISLPFSCVLGLLSSMIASTMGEFIIPFTTKLFIFLLFFFINPRLIVDNAILGNYFPQHICEVIFLFNLFLLFSLDVRSLVIFNSN